MPGVDTGLPKAQGVRRARADEARRAARAHTSCSSSSDESTMGGFAFRLASISASSSDESKVGGFAGRFFLAMMIVSAVGARRRLLGAPRDAALSVGRCLATQARRAHRGDPRQVRGGGVKKPVPGLLPRGAPTPKPPHPRLSTRPAADELKTACGDASKHAGEVGKPT